MYSPQTGRGGETKEINREREIWGGYVCVDAERRDKFPRIAWNRQNRSLFYGYGEYSCLHVIVMMIYISIRESIFFPGFLATRNSSPLYFLYIYYSELYYFYRESFKGRIHGCSISTLYTFIKEWIGRIERESMTCKWMMETLSVEASRVRVHQEGPPPVFFTTSRSGTVINFLHLRFECLLDILSLFHISRVMDGSIGIHELSSIL